jgi:hypothetical protein
MLAASGDPLMSEWAQCVGAYAKPRLKSESTEKIVTDGLAACHKEELAVGLSYMKQFGPQKGTSAFAGVKYQVRSIMLRRVQEAKAAAGVQ